MGGAPRVTGKRDLIFISGRGNLDFICIMDSIYICIICILLYMCGFIYSVFYIFYCIVFICDFICMIYEFIIIYYIYI